MAESHLVRWMERKRADLGIGHAQFARLLGISVPLWQLYRTGDRKPSLRTLRRLLQEWPEDEAAILGAVKEDPPPGEPDADEG